MHLPVFSIFYHFSPSLHPPIFTTLIAQVPGLALFLLIAFFPRDLFCPLISFPCSTFILSLPLLRIQLQSLCVFRLVSSARPSYIPGMPATYGPHSSRSAERPTAPRRRPYRNQPRAECAAVLLQPKIILIQL